MCDLIDHLKEIGKWKTYLTMKFKFISSTDSNKKHTFYLKSGIGGMTMSCSNTNEIIHKLLDSLMHRHKTGLEQSVKDRNLIFDIVSEMHYLDCKMSITCGGSYTVSPRWISDKIATLISKIMMMPNVFSVQ